MDVLKLVGYSLGFNKTCYEKSPSESWRYSRGDTVSKRSHRTQMLKETVKDKEKGKCSECES